MGTLKNTFSWSKSREGLFDECKRKYFLQYYGAWEGWDKSAPTRTRNLYVLKQLQTRALWAGSVVHDHIKHLLFQLRNGSACPSVDEAIEKTLALMRADFKSSREGNYWKKPKTLGLFEHEYELNIAKEKWQENAEHVKNCLRNFYQSEALERIKKLDAHQWLEMEELSSFELEGVKIYVVLDFSFRDGDEIVIYDWKTGRSNSEDNTIQLACYALYASNRWGIEPEKVKTIEFNLAKNQIKDYHVGGIQVEEVCEHIRKSSQNMLEILVNPQKNQAREEDFPFTENERTCRYCNFKKECPREH